VGNLHALKSARQENGQVVEHLAALVAGRGNMAPALGWPLQLALVSAQPQSIPQKAGAVAPAALPEDTVHQAGWNHLHALACAPHRNILCLDTACVRIAQLVSGANRPA
jgi:hypothetical protein